MWWISFLLYPFINFNLFAAPDASEATQALLKTEAKTACMAWIYLFVASCFEIAWLYSVKLFSKDKIAAINWADFFVNTDGFLALAPALGYVGFGICQILFFAAAMKTLPASTAFAVWTGVTLIGTKIVDTAFFKEPVSPIQLLFFGFILAGIIGLRFKTP